MKTNYHQNWSILEDTKETLVSFDNAISSSENLSSLFTEKINLIVFGGSTIIM